MASSIFLAPEARAKKNPQDGKGQFAVEVVFGNPDQIQELIAL
jgi:hypothetical protein